MSSSLGLRFARASGDFNPHHLFTWTAKMLGYKQPIAHGMWTIARCLAHMQSSGMFSNVLFDQVEKVTKSHTGLSSEAISFETCESHCSVCFVFDHFHNTTEIILTADINTRVQWKARNGQKPCAEMCQKLMAEIQNVPKAECHGFQANVLVIIPGCHHQSNLYIAILNTNFDVNRTIFRFCRCLPGEASIPRQRRI